MDNAPLSVEMPVPLDILKTFFGYDRFRRGQEESINGILEGRDVLCVMPTGSGKSLCYQIPAILLGGVTVIISPLISLMKDQVDALRQNGVMADAVNSSLEWEDALAVFRRVRRGETKILYVAPERLEGVGFREFLSSVDIDMIVVDEAHCVSQWGHDFRPSYLRISSMVESLSRRPVVAAFTATATKQVREDIIEQLSLDDPQTMITGFDRENLFFQVEHPKDKAIFLLDYLKKFPDMPGIVYCSTRKAVEEVCNRIRESGIEAVRYHAGLSDFERRSNQDAFIYDRATVMVATNAFGMGIDKSNVRYVIHHNMPSSIDSYYQEAGRAGRDGAPAECIVLFSQRDIMIARYLISQSDDSEARETAFTKLQSMIDYSNTSACLRHYILRYFGEDDIPKSPDVDGCGDCGNCSSVTEKADVTIEAQKILSCVYRMAERTGGRHFGQSMLNDVLRGSRKKAVKGLGLDEISTWGLMKEYTADGVRDIVNFLIAEGLLTVSGEEFPTVQFSEKSRPFLKNGTRLLMRKYEEGRPTKVAKSKTNIKDGAPEDAALFEELRELRRELAAKEGIPPYIVFTDKTLIAMCAARPKNDEEFLQVPGVGKAKLEKYGESFLRAIKDWKES